MIKIKTTKKATKQGEREAYIGMMCLYGFLGRQDYDKAIYWFKKAAEHGNVRQKKSSDI